MITVETKVTIGTSNSVPPSRNHKNIVLTFTESVEYASHLPGIAEKVAALIKSVGKHS